MKLVLLLMLTILSLESHSSALVRKDPEALTLTFESHIFLYGEADDELAQKIAEEINDVWNNQNIETPLDGSLYDLKFKVTASAVPFSKVFELAQSTPEAAFNFVRVIPGPNSHLTSSFMVGHTNSGVWLLSQGLGNSKTSAHEYGHSLGLDHPAGESFSGYPRIMLTDYYEVETPYQLPSGKLDLTTRKVTEIDVAELRLERLIFDDNQTAPIGRYDMIFIFDEEGNILNY